MIGMVGMVGMVNMISWFNAFSLLDLQSLLSQKPLDHCCTLQSKIVSEADYCIL